MFDVEIDILSNVNWNTETNFFFKVYGEDIIDTIIWIKFEIILFFQWQINITCIILYTGYWIFVYTCEESQSHHINKNWIFNYDLLEICLNVL